MSETWRDWPRGAAVLAGIIGRDLARRAPRPISMRERLAMLPDRALPVDAPVTVRWDEHQIPFIEARSDRDLAVALGVVHAHLRLGQMEIMRRIAAGRISEMVGPLGIGADRAIRLLELGRATPEMAASLPPDTRQWAEGFLAGVNHHLAHAALPREFAVLAMAAEPWTLADLMLMLRLGSADISWLIWSKLLRLRKRMAPGAWAALWPRLLSGDAPASMDGRGAGLAARACAATARGGSNCAAVSERLTGTGAALIASDPHLPYGLPNPWLIAGMRSPGFHCVSLMMPGLPFMALGRNPDAAWGGTSLHAQSSDLFDISGLPEGEVTERFETIRVRGAPDRRLRLRRTAHGPVVSDATLLPSPRPLALRWMGHEASDELSAMLAVAKCRDWAGFRAALTGFGVSGLNMVFAGRNGSVGHLLAAHLPRRPTQPPDDLHLPLASEAAWDLRIDASGLPVRASPDHAAVVSANERPEGGAVPAGFFFAPPDRSQRMMELIGQAAPFSAGAAFAMQQDVSARGSLALRDLLAGSLAVCRRPEGQRRMLAALLNWDGTYGAGSEGALAFELLLGGVVRRLGAPGRTPAYDAVWATQALLREDLRSRPEAWLRNAVERSLRPGARRFGRLRAWGAFHQVALKHPLGWLPLIGHRYRTGAFAGEGSNNTVHKTGHRIGAAAHRVSFGSCARHVSDMSDPDANFMALLGGQDGWFGSENFDDLTPLWRRGAYVQLPLRAEAVRARHRHVTTLRPD